MEVFDTITHPWRNPVEYTQLVFWFVIFLFAAWAMMDGLRLFTREVQKAVT